MKAYAEMTDTYDH
jgi:hypothetical protein